MKPTFQITREQFIKNLSKILNFNDGTRPEPPSFSWSSSEEEAFRTAKLRLSVDIQERKCPPEIRSKTYSRLLFIRRSSRILFILKSLLLCNITLFGVNSKFQPIIIVEFWFVYFERYICIVVKYPYEIESLNSKTIPKAVIMESSKTYTKDSLTCRKTNICQLKTIIHNQWS